METAPRRPRSVILAVNHDGGSPAFGFCGKDGKMNKKELEEKLMKILSSVAEGSGVSVSNGNLVPLKDRRPNLFIQLLYAVDDEFGTPMTMEDVVMIDTVGDLADRILAKID